MDITINGDRRAVPAPQTVETLLESLGIDGRKVAVELNVEIVPRSAYGDTRLGDGDRVEIVHFIGGGDEFATERPTGQWPTLASQALGPSAPGEPGPIAPPRPML